MQRLPIMKLDTDRILGVTALIVGVASLAVVVYQTQLERRVQSASVLPYLTMAVTLNNQETFFTLRNAGLGPARINRVRVLHKGGDVEGDASDFYVKMRTDKEAPFDVDPIKVGRLIPAGEWIRMLGTATADATRRELFVKEMLRLFEVAEVPRLWYATLREKGVVTEGAVLEITYSSVFGEQWVVRSDNIVPTTRP
jgi:hypothetical protein